MEIIRGKQASFMDALTFAECLNGYPTRHIDMGTGDGRFVQHMARTHPRQFVIGVDACRENLCAVSRRAPTNALFVIANARAIPSELVGMATSVSINFPWGSLLDGLLTEDAALICGLMRLMRPNAALDIRLNGGALADAGWSLEMGVERVQSVLVANGFVMRPIQPMWINDLKRYPTSWAKRIAFGRDPRAVHLSGMVHINGVELIKRLLIDAV